MTAPARLADGVRLVADPAAELGAVPALLDRATAADGFAAVNEAGRLALAAGGAGREHLLTGPAGAPTGYAALDSDPGPQVSAELVVDPAARRHGLGRALLDSLRVVAATSAPGSAVAVWAHHDSAAARALARSAGLVETRVLLLLGRDLGAGPPLPAAPLPDGIRLAAFRPGVDDDAWVAVNAAAFAGHPEQGRWTVADLRARLAEPWFDSAGFLLAWRDSRLVGFNWTKVESSGGVPSGEIYVLGVAPDSGVHGLGTALGVAGLQYLRARGVEAVELYVEADNERALRVYRRLGFSERSRDVQWTTPA